MEWRSFTSSFLYFRETQGTNGLIKSAGWIHSMDVCIQMNTIWIDICEDVPQPDNDSSSSTTLSLLT